MQYTDYPRRLRPYTTDDPPGLGECVAVLVEGVFRLGKVEAGGGPGHARVAYEHWTRHGFDRLLRVTVPIETLLPPWKMRREQALLDEQVRQSVEMPEAQPLRAGTPSGRMVADADRGRWQDALQRGQLHQLTVTRCQLLNAGGVTMRGYRVSSYSEANRYYEVAVATDYTGSAWVVCPCTAGQHGDICQHAALALLDSGVSPIPLYAMGELDLETAATA